MNLKKLVIGIIVVIILIGLIAWGVIAMNNNQGNNNVNTASVTDNKENNNQANTNSNETQVNTTDITDTNDNSNEESKILIAYFSLPETDDPNNMTQEEENSTIVVNGEVLGNTQYVAELIQEETGADIFRIVAQNDYPLDHDTLVDQALEEQESNARPAIRDTIENMDEYDVIFLGYPNWWGDMPMIIYTFLEQYNFDGKTIIPFNTHGGSGLSATVSTITEKLPNSNVLENAFTLSRNRMEEAPTEVRSWLNEIGFTN